MSSPVATLSVLALLAALISLALSSPIPSPKLSLWSSKGSPPTSLDSSSCVASQSPLRVCAFTKIKLAWSVSGGAFDPKLNPPSDEETLVSLLIFRLPSSSSSSSVPALIRSVPLSPSPASFRAYPPLPPPSAPSNNSNPIRCALSVPSCRVIIDNISLSELPPGPPTPAGDYTHVLSVFFTEETLAPPLPSISALLSAFDINPVPRDEDLLFVEWQQDGKLLVLHAKGELVASAYAGTLSMFFKAGDFQDASGKTASEEVMMFDAEGVVALRVEEPAMYEFRLVINEALEKAATTLATADCDEGEILSSSNFYEVFDCDEDADDKFPYAANPVLISSSTLLPSDPTSSTSTSIVPGAPPRLPPPIFSPSSRLSLPGSRPYRLPSSLFPPSAVGRTLSMWLYIAAARPQGTESQNGHAPDSFRTLFYKGKAEVGAVRTPSAFFVPVSDGTQSATDDLEEDHDDGGTGLVSKDSDTNPDSDRPEDRTNYLGLMKARARKSASAPLDSSRNPVLLQVSTAKQTDLGATSVGSGVLLGGWTHVAVVLTNFSAAAIPPLEGEPQYRYELYVDGVLDTRLQFTDVVLSDDEPLLLGAAPGMPGPPMVVSELSVFDAALDAQQLKLLKIRSTARHMAADGSAVGAYGPHFVANGLLPLSADELGEAGAKSSVSSKHRKGMREALIADAEKLINEDCRDPKQRIHLWEDAADLGSARAALHAAEMYLYGIEESVMLKRNSDGELCEFIPLEDRSASKGMALLERASAGGSGDAMYKLSILMSSGIGAIGVTGASDIAGAELFLPGVASSLLTSSWAKGSSKIPAVGTGLRIMEAPLATTKITHTEMGAASVELLHLAAASGHTKAMLALAHRYQKGYGVAVDHEAAAHYYRLAAEEADVYYHTPGNQPFHEMHRLREGHEKDIQRGQKGNDDEELQFTIMMAEQGDIDAMNGMANMLYWGSRGFARDHVKALEYWNAAAEKGHVGAMCGAASMYIRGEGIAEKDAAKAVELYERAASLGSATALNGLGYAYFLGQGGLEQDYTRAFGYFNEAAKLEQDADSLANAAHCYSTGKGTPQDEVMAAALYDKAAQKFGSFDAALEMGKRHHEGGRGVGRSPEQAVKYLAGAARLGASGELLRKGFDLYLAGEFDAALKIYAEAAEIGYEVGANNAAYLLDVGAATIEGPRITQCDGSEGEGSDEGERGALVLFHQENRVTTTTVGSGALGPSSPPSELGSLLNKAASLRFHWMSAEDGNNPDSFAAIGDSYYYGAGGAAVDFEKALWWYSKAASVGSVKGAYYCGFMYENYKRDLDRATRHYKKVLETVEKGGEGGELVWLVKLSMWRCDMKRGWLWRNVLRRLWEGAGTEAAPLPRLLRGEEGDVGISEEGGTLARVSMQIKKMAKVVNWYARNAVFRHRGNVFGSNYYVDKGYDVVWENVAFIALLLLLIVSLVRFAAKIRGRRRRG